MKSQVKVHAYLGLMYAPVVQHEDIYNMGNPMNSLNRVILRLHVNSMQTKSRAIFLVCGFTSPCSRHVRQSRSIHERKRICFMTINISLEWNAHQDVIPIHPPHIQIRLHTRSLRTHPGSGAQVTRSVPKQSSQPWAVETRDGIEILYT